jgi:hypothetical protein
MSASPWLEYRLEKLAFHNRGELGFRRARMLYNEQDHIIAIEHLDSSRQDIDAALREIANADGSLPAIKTIYYEMRVDGYRPMAFFYHPLKREAEVFLLPREAGRTRLFFRQVDGRPMFSKDWTLREVSRGKIPSDRAVWQFHGYQHEH